MVNGQITQTSVALAGNKRSSPAATVSSVRQRRSSHSASAARRLSLPPAASRRPPRGRRPGAAARRADAHVAAADRGRSAGTDPVGDQRIIIQRQLTRATRIGIAAIILLLIAIAVGAFAILSGGDDDGGAPTTAEVVENVTPLTTFIASESAVGRSRRTGWICDSQNGYVVANAHVVAGAGSQYRVGVTSTAASRSCARRSSSATGCPRTRPSPANPDGLRQFRSPSSRG